MSMYDRCTKARLIISYVRALHHLSKCDKCAHSEFRSHYERYQQAARAIFVNLPSSWLRDLAR